MKPYKCSGTTNPEIPLHFDDSFYISLVVSPGSIPVYFSEFPLQWFVHLEPSIPNDDLDSNQALALKPAENR